MLKITNKNDFDLIDRYDGKDYIFPAGETVLCPDSVARHVFGVGDDDKKPYLTRQGWLRLSDKFDEGMKKLNNFVFDLLEEKHDVEFACIEQRTSPSANAGAEVEAGADDSVGTSVPAPVIQRNILKRFEQQQAPA
jgi:hypothetical protein